MYHPTTRLLTTLELLQGRDRIGSGELARRLEVTPRSVRRYVQMLQDLGIPVQAERGPGGGYGLRPGFKLPPLMFTDEEALALTLALLALPRLGLVLDAPAAAGALAKIERVLPPAVRERVRAVQERIVLETGPRGPGDGAAGGLVVLLSEAAQGGRRVWLRYRSGTVTEEETEREIDPYAVVCWAQSWYVVGHCHLRRGLRMFRLDRVLAVEPRETGFALPVGFDALDFALRSFATMPGRWEVEAELALPVDLVRRWMPPTLGVIEAAAGGGTILRCRSDDLDWMARELLGFRCRFAVRRPAELRAELRRLAVEIAAMAEDDVVGPAGDDGAGVQRRAVEASLS